LQLRHAHPVLRQPAFFAGRAVEGGDGCKDLAWFHPAGREMTDGDWFDTGLRTIGMYLDGRGLRHRDVRGNVIVDESFLLILHSGDEPIMFAPPGPPYADYYDVVIDTREAGGNPPAAATVPGGDAIHLDGRVVLLLHVVRRAGVAVVSP
jgi:isoamylase